MKIYFYPCTLDYFLSDNSDLKSVLTDRNAGLPSVTKVDEQVIDSPDGLEALPELCQRKALPFVVLFEDAFHFDDDNRNDVPVTSFSQSIYVMRMASPTAPSRPLENQCLADVVRIRALLLARLGAGDPQVQNWNRRPKRDFVRGASNYVGWRLKLDFTEDDDWTIHEQE